MKVTFDPVKSEKNRLTRNLPFEKASDFEMVTARIKAVERDGEQRLLAIGKCTFSAFSPQRKGFASSAFGLQAGRNGGTMKTIEKFWDTTGTDDWTDDEGEVRELSGAEIASMTPFAELPEELKASLLQWKDATFSPEPTKMTVKIALSRDVREKFEAMGAGWESKVDGALRQWLEEHQAS